jgi:hypothetical protein
VFASASLAISRWLPWRGAEVAAAVVFAGMSVATSFASEYELLIGIAIFAVCAAVLAGVGVAIASGLSFLARRAPSTAPKVLLGLGAIVALGATMELYVDWSAYVGAYHEGGDSHEGGEIFWKSGWAEHAESWRYVRTETPSDATIAFANTAYVYPLYGFHCTHRVVYAPVRPGIAKFADVPRLGETVPGDLILDAMTAAQNADADRATWVTNLGRLGVDFVVIYKDDRSKDPPELRFVAELPDKFHRAFEDEHAIIYRIDKP